MWLPAQYCKWLQISLPCGADARGARSVTTGVQRLTEKPQRLLRVQLEFHC